MPRSPLALSAKTASTSPWGRPEREMRVENLIAVGSDKDHETARRLRRYRTRGSSFIRDILQVSNGSSTIQDATASPNRPALLVETESVRSWQNADRSATDRKRALPSTSTARPNR